MFASAFMITQTINAHTDNCKFKPKTETYLRPYRPKTRLSSFKTLQKAARGPAKSDRRMNRQWTWGEARRTSDRPRDQGRAIHCIVSHIYGTAPTIGLFPTRVAIHTRRQLLAAITIPDHTAYRCPQPTTPSTASLQLPLHTRPSGSE